MRMATEFLRAVILCYRYALSPVLPGACRFDPSCSAYALDAVSRFGAWKGGWLALRRLGRCHPWGGWGHDPVPLETDPRRRERSARHRAAPGAPPRPTQQ